MNFIKGFLKNQSVLYPLDLPCAYAFDTVIEQQQVIEAGFSLTEGMLAFPNRLC